MSEPVTQKDVTRARILDVAAREMRRVGTDGIGVAALMQQAGLTHGGFYAHFASREDLVAHAIDRMFADSQRLFSHFFDGAEPARGLGKLIDFYLSDKVRKTPERNCPIPALSGEAHRLPEAARRRFAAGVEQFEQGVADALEAIGHADPENLSVSVVAEMVGAMALARSRPGEAAARALLEAVRGQLKARLGIPPSVASTPEPKH